jgi:tetratricopeptide (TPR) repeat protein
MDDRGYYPPDYYLTFSSDDYFSFRDPVMDAIKLNNVRSLKDILYNEGVGPFREELKVREEENGPMINWFPYTAYDLSLYTVNVLIANGKFEEALEMASLNSTLFPSEIWGWFISGMIFSNIGNNEEASNCFGKLLEIEPCHQEAIWEMEKLSALQAPYKPDSTVMKKLAGEYEGRSVILEDGILKYRTGAGKQRNLIPVNDHRYIPEGSNTRVVFELSDSKVLRMKIEQWDGTTNWYGRKW